MWGAWINQTTTKTRDFRRQIPGLWWLPCPPCFHLPCFSRDNSCRIQAWALFSSRPSLHHSLFLSHSAFSWKSFSAAAKTAWNAFVSFNSGACLAWLLQLAPLQDSLSTASLRRGLVLSVWTVFPWRGGESLSQACDEGLQVTDLPCATSNRELLWGCCQGLMHDVFVI